MVSFLILGYLGTVPVTVWGQFTGGWAEILDTKDRATWVARIFTVRLFPLLPAHAVVHRARQNQARAGKGALVMNKLACLILAVATLFAAGAALADESDLRLPPAPVNRLDQESLQRGARNFVNYCLNCHSAKYMRYNRLQDIGLTEQQIKDNLMFPTDKIGDTMTAAMKPEDAKRWFGAVPPDLSVESRVRGHDWLYSYLLAFYRDDKSPTGWNNLVFPNVGMPHVLWQLGGTNKLVEAEFEDHEKAEGAAIAARGISKIEPGPAPKYIVRTLAQETPGTLSQGDYAVFVADLVNYLDYMAEPSRNDRMRLGIVVLLFLALLFVFAYWTKVEFWKDLH